MLAAICGKLSKGGAAKTLAIVVLLASCLQAVAAGTITFPSYGAMPVLSFPATLSASRDAPVGTVLNSKAGNAGLAASGLTCDVQKDATVSGILVPGSTNVYQTGVPGIGVRFYMTSGWKGSWVSVPVSQTLTQPNGTTAHYTRADLVVTGPVGSGAIATWPSMTVRFTGSCIATVTATQYLTGSVAMTSNTCSVTTPSLDFALPKALTKDLVAPGATTGDTTESLGLNCAAGVKVAVTLSDAVSPQNRSTTLSLAPESSASGIGLQILHGTTQVAFGPDSAVANNTNQWTAGTASGGAMQVPLTARYVRTTDTLTPGSVKGKATFTMSYQ
ncbi:adhesin 20K [Caballeronia jiangsuensis]|nr:adhesin 20K [Caballeronia jiangsuensis]